MCWRMSLHSLCHNSYSYEARAAMDSNGKHTNVSCMLTRGFKSVLTKNKLIVKYFHPFRRQEATQDGFDTSAGSEFRPDSFQ